MLKQDTLKTRCENTGRQLTKLRAIFNDPVGSQEQHFVNDIHCR